MNYHGPIRVESSKKLVVMKFKASLKCLVRPQASRSLSKQLHNFALGPTGDRSVSVLIIIGYVPESLELPPS